MKTAPRKRKPLPLLTPEYLHGGESTFTLRYFEELYKRLKPPFFIVFDNYQDVPLKSPFHEVMLGALSHVPEGVNVIVMSRGDIPDTLIRLKAHGCINLLPWEEIRFTEEESREIIVTRTKKLCSEETARHLYRLSDGWIAGLILISEIIKREKAEPRFQSKYTFEEIFAYFAQEVFERLDQKTQDFFLATVLLPKMTVRMAEGLTGDNASGDILHAVYRNNYFTAKQISSGNAYYEYHPLYREFLLSRARTMLPPQTLISLHRRAAMLLEKEGQTESAISLLKDIADWEGMIGIIMSHAPEMLKQGRHLSLQEWLNSLPAKIMEPHSWLCYWKGMSLLPFSPLSAKNFFEQAFAGFQSANHLMESILAASGVLNAIAYGYDDCKAFEYWYAILNDLAAGIEKFPDEESEALLITSMVLAIRGGDISHPGAEIWGERAVAIKETSTTINTKIHALCYLFWHRLNNKGIHDARPLLRLLQKLSRSRNVQSASEIIICFAEVMYHGISGHHDELLGAVKKGLELSETTGIHIMDMWFHSALPISFLNVMDHKNARICFEKMESLVESWPKLTQCLHNGQLAREALICNDLHEAIHYGKSALDLAQVTGSKYSLAASQLILAGVCHRLGKHEEALQHLENGHRYAETTNTRSLLIMSLLLKAQFSFDSGEETDGMQLLHNSLTLAREGGYVYAVLDDPFITVHMCEKALAAGIEIKYVQEIIRRRGLIPDKPPLHIESWPWTLKIHTLGRFEVILNGTSSQFELKSQKKPLLLLKALIALGGNEVRGDEIADILWPDAEGDMAHHSFENILYRLRKLLGCHEALQLKEGRLTLDPCYCWVDAWAFERLLKQADELNQQGQKDCSLDLMEKAAELYRGDFLAGDIKESWPKPLAERLKRKNLKNILRLGDYLAADGGPAVAYGISGGGDTLVNNSGSISASATGVAGIPVHAFGIITNDTVLNTGNISATANGDNCTAAGIYSMASGVTNTGNVIVDAASMNTGLVYGINSNGEVSNAGNITTTARGGLNNTAYGISAADIVANTGNINVTAATTASGGISNAHGIMANGTVSNAGNIAVYSQGDISNAVGILSFAGTNANNSGKIIVTSVGSTSHAYGIYFMNGGTLTNTGVIRASDNNAYEVYVNAGTVDLLNSYKMTLDGNPAKGSTFLNAGSTINLNSSQFSVSDAPDTRFYTQYRIFDGKGTVNGAFGSVAPAQNPAVSVLYHGQGTAGSADDTVSLSYHPRTSPFLEGINVNRYLLNASLATVQQQQINGFLNSLLPGPPIQMAANDTVASDAPSNLIKSTPDDNVYIIPYYAYLDKDSNRLGYEVNSTGFTAGYEKRFSRTQLGVHLGYGFADVDFNGSDFPKSTEDQQKIFSLGFHGMTRWGNWALRGDLTGFYDHHDYEGVSGVNFEAREKADYNSWGTTENLLGGYAFKAGTNVLLPEIGLNHTWVRQEGFQTSATFGGWETDNSSVDNNLFQALASLRWLTRFSLFEIPCMTSLTIGGRYRMSNDDLTVQQSVPGSSPVTVASDQERAAAMASFSLALRKDNFTSELAYSGDYSYDNILHAVWLKIAYAF